MKKEKVKVLIFGMTSIVGGIETFLMNLYEKINLENLQIDFLVPGTLEDKYKRRIEDRGGKVYEVEKIRKHPVNSVRQLKKIYKENNYDVLHMNLCNAFFFLYALPGVWLNKNIRVICHSHNGGDSKKLLHKISKPLLNHYCTDFVACSDIAAKWLFTNKKINQNEVLVINNAIDTEKFLYDENIRNLVRKKYNIDTSDFIIGHVGRFEEQKNHKFIIELAKKMLNISSTTKLMLIGTGTLQDEIKNMVKQLNIEDNVIFTGVSSNVNEMYQAMDVFILPSIFEGLPVSCIEAQTSGLKCLLSDKITKEVGVTSNVKFLPIENNETWVKELKNIIDNPYKRENMKYEIESANYDMESEVKKIEKLYLRKE